MVLRESGTTEGGTNMLVTNILLCFVIVVLLAILYRLSDMYYAKIEKESAEELRDYIERIKKLNDREE